MVIVYTEHAKSRMVHRRILKSEVEDTVLRPDFTVPSRLGRFVAVRKFGGKYLKVVCEKSNGKIIVVTVYWTRRT